MKKFKIVSKFKEGQILFTIHEGKVICGPCIGFRPELISKINYDLTGNDVQIKYGNTVWAKESSCYTSLRALIKGIQS